MSTMDSLEVLQEKIRQERKFVDKKPYSHNIISLLLSQIDRVYGKDAANETIKKFKLEKLGWSVSP